MEVRMIGTHGPLGKETSGLFWVTESELIAVPFTEKTRTAYSEAVSKSGNTFIHEKRWSAVKPDRCNKEYP